jgi:hypothetical protein
MVAFKKEQNRDPDWALPPGHGDRGTSAATPSYVNEEDGQFEARTAKAGRDDPIITAAIV